MVEPATSPDDMRYRLIAEAERHRELAEHHSTISQHHSDEAERLQSLADRLNSVIQEANAVLTSGDDRSLFEHPRPEGIPTRRINGATKKAGRPKKIDALRSAILHFVGATTRNEFGADAIKDAVSHQAVEIGYNVESEAFTDAFNGILRSLIGEGRVEVLQKPIGRRPGLYRRGALM